VIDLVQKNVAHARASAGRGCCEVFLAHYDEQGAEAWPQDWYKSEVAGNMSESGFKFQLLQRGYERHGRRWESQYSFVWVLDEDMDLQGTNMSQVLKLANESSSFIIGPSLKQTDGEIQWKIQEPDPMCAFRYTNYVEVIAPILRTSALHTILEDCVGCIHEETVWGLDGVWCKFAGSVLRPKDPDSACAILDATPVVHRNWKTLNGKYTKTKSGIFPGLSRGNFQLKGDHDAKEVKKRYPNFYVGSKSQETLQCVRADGSTVGPFSAHLRVSASDEKQLPKKKQRRRSMGLF